MQKIMKKLGTIMMGSLLMGATLLGPASAATTLDQYPAPFATVDGISSVIVVGATAATEDVVGAINIGAKLAQTGAESQTVSVSCDAGSASVTDGVQVKSVATNLYLEGALNDTLKRRVTSADLPNVLADGTVLNTKQDEIKFTQQLILGGNTVSFGKPTTDVTTPTLYMDVPTDELLTTMKVVFENAVDYTTLSGKTINMFGKDYTFSSAVDELQLTKLVLYGGGEKMTVDAGGAQKSVELEGKTVTIQMSSWTSDIPAKAIITVNGVTDTYAQGSYISIAGFDSKIYVKTVTATKTPSAAGGAGESAYAELFVGSDKLIFESNAVKAGKDEETIQGATATVTNSSLTITYAPNEDSFVAVGNSITEPVFNAIKFQFNGIDPAMNAAGRETITVKQDGSSTMAITLPTVSGMATLQFAHFDGTNFYLADKSNYSIVLTEGIAIKKTEYFTIGTADTGSKLLQITSFDVGSTASKTTIKDLGTGATTIYSYNDAEDNFFYVAGIPFKYVVDFNSATPSISNLTVDMNGNGDIMDAGVTSIYTPNAAKIDIGAVNETSGDVTVTVTEDGADRVPDSVFGSNSVIVVNAVYTAASTNRYGISAYTSTGVTANYLTGTSASLAQVGDTYLYTGITKWGTSIELSGDSNGPLNAKISYAESPSVAQVFVGEPGMSVATSTTDGTTSSASASVSVPAIPTAGIAKLDSKVSDAEKLGNLILVGGPAVNTLVAELAADGKAMAATDWRAEDETGVRINKDKAKIQIVDNAFGDGSVALIVAGYSAVDTGNAAYVLQNYNTFSSALAGKTEVTVSGITVADVE
ncbi:MAG: S-layer protein [DPANN group archaeon]|nr:S-layer protein [DPANN group archaeon]